MGSNADEPLRVRRGQSRCFSPSSSPETFACSSSGVMTTNYSPTNAGQVASDLRARRERAGLTRTRLAGLVGCSPTSLANIEDGAIPRHSEVLRRALAVLVDPKRATAP